MVPNAGGRLLVAGQRQITYKMSSLLGIGGGRVGALRSSSRSMQALPSYTWRDDMLHLSYSVPTPQTKIRNYQAYFAVGCPRELDPNVSGSSRAVLSVACPWVLLVFPNRSWRLAQCRMRTVVTYPTHICLK